MNDNITKPASETDTQDHIEVVEKINTARNTKSATKTPTAYSIQRKREAEERAKKFKRAREDYLKFSLFAFEDAEKAAKYWLRQKVSIRCEQHRVILTTVDGVELEVDSMDDLSTIMGKDEDGYFDCEDVDSTMQALKCCFRQFAN